MLIFYGYRKKIVYISYAPTETLKAMAHNQKIETRDINYFISKYTKEVKAVRTAWCWHKIASSAKESEKRTQEATHTSAVN